MSVENKCGKMPEPLSDNDAFMILACGVCFAIGLMIGFAAGMYHEQLYEKGFEAGRAAATETER